MGRSRLSPPTPGGAHVDDRAVRSEGPGAGGDGRWRWRRRIHGGRAARAPRPEVVITIGRIQQSRAPFPAPAPGPGSRPRTSRSANSPRPEPRSLAHARAALRSGSRKNATYAAFREVGRVTRTVQLLRYLSDAPLRRRTALISPLSASRSHR
ncbi:Tn3 family transposase [Streptomyces sp. NBC_01207]|uniref:Tn3 family transposase n=1 Tax=Streptomyces sp. NBC_01207 TaxID=2903772 RepID=UPI003FA3846D